MGQAAFTSQQNTSLSVESNFRTSPKWCSATVFMLMLASCLLLGFNRIAHAQGTPDFASLYELSSGTVATVETISVSPEGKQGRGIGSAVLVSEDELLTACLLYTSPSPRDS